MNRLESIAFWKKFALVPALVLASLFTVSAQRIASVDINQILESLDEYKTAQDNLDKVAAQWRQDIAQEYDQIRGLYNRYQAEQVLMSDDARAKKEEEIMEREKAVRDLQKNKFGPEGELFKRRQEMVKPIQDKVYATIEEYANEQGYDFIFDRGGATGIIFSNARYDKTADIIKRLK